MMRSRGFWALAWLVGLTGIGMLGFVWLEDLSWLDAVYLTVVTLSTVGFGDLVPQTPEGRLFTTALIAGGVGVAFYLISRIARDVLEGRFRDLFRKDSRMRKIEKLSGHVIVCGYGRFGRVVVDELLGAGRRVVVIELDPACETLLERSGAEYLIGSATSDELLLAAGLERAEALVLATSSEADSVFVTLFAKEVKPDIRVHARAESESAVRRIRRAGADYVNSPYQMGGLRTATSILNPSVVDFLEISLPQRTEEIGLEEVSVGPGSQIDGRPVVEIEREHPRLRIVGLKRQSRSIELVPDPVQAVEAGDYLVVIGEGAQLSRLARHALSESRSTTASERP
jgi:voltage-gated potassium channel